MTSIMLALSMLWAFNQYQIEIAPIRPECEFNNPLCGIETDTDQVSNYLIPKLKSFDLG